MIRPLSVNRLRKQLQHTLWVPVILMATAFLGAVALLLYREQAAKARADQAALDALLTSQRALIAQEIFLAQNDAVGLRIEGLLKDWKARGSRNEACVQIVLHPETSRAQSIGACSSETLRPETGTAKRKESAISVGDQTLAVVKSAVATQFKWTDLFPPLLLLIVVGAGLVALYVHSALVRRVERTVLTPLLDKLSQEGRNAAIAQTARMVAHDIRKPFQLLQLALLKLQGSSHPEVRELGEQLDSDISSTAQSVDSMLKDLLDVDKDFVPDMKAEPLSRLVDHAVDTLKRLYPQASTTFSVEVPENLVAQADREQILRVLINLGENALQAMNLKGSLAIVGRSTESGPVEMAFTNSGPKIPECHHGSIFRPMFTTRKAGTGLGLAISKRIIDKHGGRLWLDASNDAGTTFKFTLNRVVESPLAKGAEFSLAKEVEDSPVLIFDDEKFFRDAWRDWAIENAASVSAYGSWEEFIASEKTQLETGTVALLDIHFENSQYDGIDIARKLNQLGVSRLFAITSDPATASESKVFEKVLGKVIPRGRS